MCIKINEFKLFISIIIDMYSEHRSIENEEEKIFIKKRFGYQYPTANI